MSPEMPESFFLPSKVVRQAEHDRAVYLSALLHDIAASLRDLLHIGRDHATPLKH